MLVVTPLLVGLVAVAVRTDRDSTAPRLEGRAPAATQRTPAVEASFQRESYAPGHRGVLRLFNTARSLRLQIFQAGPERVRTIDDSTMNGVPLTRSKAIGPGRRGRKVAVPIGPWPSGVYFARLQAADGRIGFAPFVVRPNRLGRHRVAVVMPTLTWQAYNLRDGNRDGTGDSWYACPRRNPEDCPTGNAVRLHRPFLNRGVPSHFRSYDLPFLHWLSWNGHEVDYLAQRDLERVKSPSVLARAYRLIVFPGHHEYVTEREYDHVEGYRNLGGNLMFLSANNFFVRVVRKGDSIEKKKQWRELERPEAALIGVQYRGSDQGVRRGRWAIRPARASAWVFTGTGLRPGAKFADGGIEIDRTTKDSPQNVQVLAEMRNLFGPGFTAQMTYYETPRGAKVFAAGAFTLAGASLRRDVSTVLDNLWRRLTRP
jgi:hypothetical protein